MPTKKREHPQSLVMQCPAKLVFAAAADGDAAKRPTFEITAYDGNVIIGSSWGFPAILDLDGLTIPAQVPVRRDHDPSRLVGHTTAVQRVGSEITAKGVVSFETEDANALVAAAKNGFPWQASVGVVPARQGVEYLPHDATGTVNGLTVKGPLDIIRKSSLQEISIVDVGAATGTKVTVAAQKKGSPMGKRTNLQATATDETEDEATAEAAESEANPECTCPPADEEQNADASAGKKAQASARHGTPRSPRATGESEVLAMRAAAAKESKRIADIREVTANHPTLQAKAIEEGWSKDKAELEVLRASRPAAPAAGGFSGAPVDAAVLECAIMQAGRATGLEKRYDTKVLDAADKRFRGRIGLQEVLLEAAAAAGKHFRSFRSAPREVLEAAFSTMSIPGILANTANKFLLQGFMGVEQVWRVIASIRPVSDFKAVTSYRLAGGFEYEEVAPSGELKHGVGSELSYTNQAKTYGKMFTVSRQDLINDDLGALTQLPQRIGRGAALKLNTVFWTEFLNNAAFFAAGNANYFEGATTTLSLSSLGTALQKFRDQTDSDSKPIAVAPRLLLVPTALEVMAKTLMNSTEVRDTTASTKYGTNNPFAGMFSPVVSAYLANSAISGSSSTAWYLLADPADMPVIEVAFLNGVEEPTVETAEADFNVLGIQLRGYHDFGVAKQEYRGGVKSKGSA